MNLAVSLSGRRLRLAIIVTTLSGNTPVAAAPAQPQAACAADQGHQ